MWRLPDDGKDQSLHRLEEAIEMGQAPRRIGGCAGHVRKVRTTAWPASTARERPRRTRCEVSGRPRKDGDAGHTSSGGEGTAGVGKPFPVTSRGRNHGSRGPSSRRLAGPGLPEPRFARRRSRVDGNMDAGDRAYGTKIACQAHSATLLSLSRHSAWAGYRWPAIRNLLAGFCVAIPRRAEPFALCGAPVPSESSFYEIYCPHK
ncbi:hypothetical protein BDY21DRAFT_76437 [Lineolata rhizophorae]|uniref:Uncharacterized protein n=1 Tax=Lineolata rhizophorae TaxID=578093 RepID=A0A6A6NU90_9PEZI|nr:hypothetical protein BDY21DRAFT_76437 [Lineolata rhizophorae]